MHSSRFIGRLGGAAVGALLVALLAGNQPARADEPGVVRLGVVNGDVAIRRGDSNQNLAATVNAPLMASDYLSTGGGDSRAELQFNYGTFLRVGSNTQLRISQVDPSTNIVQLAAGTVELSELHTVNNARAEVDTPSVAVRPTVLGQYRITVDGNGSTIVAVRAGTVELAGSSTSQDVSSGSTMLVSGSPSNPQFRPMTNVAYDSFDSWNQNRDGYDGNIAGYQYAPQQMVGVPDLSQYGTWNNYPQYGYGWTPNNVPSNWSPYQNGQWVWEPYYGYTWVGNEPWGWAPYHYGTWGYDNSAWTWYPNSGPQYPAAPYPYVGSSYPAGYPSYPQQPYGHGTSYGSGYPPYASGYPYSYGYPYGTQTSASQLLWAPALVTFLGLASGQNLSTALVNGLGSTASLGWTPLAPGEQAYPWWGPQQAAWYGYPSSNYPYYQTYAYGQPAYAVSNAVAQPVNSYRTYNVTNVYKIYRNTRAPHGVMTINGAAFRDGHFTSIRATNLASAHLKEIAVFRNTVPLTPTAANLRFSRQAAPAHIASIAPRTTLFERFPALKQQPVQFATVHEKVTAANQKLYATHPSMPGPFLSKRTLTAPKPSAEAMDKMQQEQQQARNAQQQAARKAQEQRAARNAQQQEASKAQEQQAARKAEQQRQAARNAELRKVEPAAAPAAQRQTENQNNQGSAWQRFNQTRQNAPAAEKRPPAAEKPAPAERQAPNAEKPANDRYNPPQQERRNNANDNAKPAPAPEHVKPAPQPDRSYANPPQRQYSAPSQHQSQPQPERQNVQPAQHHTAPANASQAHPSHSNDSHSDQSDNKKERAQQGQQQPAVGPIVREDSSARLTSRALFPYRPD